MPKNTIDWGQGAVNNGIGWGLGATNNSIGWGGVHADSYGHDETNLSGEPLQITISWLGTDDPTILVQPLNFNELTLTWAGTSDPSLNVT
jgi:hypothetical protein